MGPDRGVPCRTAHLDRQGCAAVAVRARRAYYKPSRARMLRGSSAADLEVCPAWPFGVLGWPRPALRGVPRPLIRYGRGTLSQLYLPVLTPEKSSLFSLGFSHHPSRRIGNAGEAMPRLPRLPTPPRLPTNLSE